MRVPAMMGVVVSGMECFLFGRGHTALELSCPGCCAARKRCAADPGPMLYASLRVPALRSSVTGQCFALPGECCTASGTRPVISLRQLRHFPLWQIALKRVQRHPDHGVIAA